MIDYSLIVPFYNEKDICRNYDIISRFLKENLASYEIILVSDGSNEKLLKSLREKTKKDTFTKIIEIKENLGRGNAVHTGITLAKGKNIAYIDSDLEIDPIYLLDIYKYLKQYDVTTVSKFHPESRIEAPLIRHVSSVLFNLLIKVGLGSKVTDHQIGLKGFRKEVIKPILPYLKEKRWLFDVEMYYLIQKRNFNLKEIPIKMRYGFSKIRSSFVIDFLKLFLIIFVIRFRHRNFIHDEKI